jgi:hypothetical protein
MNTVKPSGMATTIHFANLDATTAELKRSLSSKALLAAESGY